MRFYEYEAKALFARHGMPLLKGRVAQTAAEAKADRRRDRRARGAQVAGPDRRPHEGRRRQVRRHAGGGRAAAAARSSRSRSRARSRAACSSSSARRSRKEYFAARHLGRRGAKLPVMIFSDMGGIDIEEVAEKHPEHVAQRALLHAPARSPTSRAKEAIAARRRQRRRPDALDADRRDAGRDLPPLRPDARRDQPARQARGRPLRRASTATSTWRTTRATSTRSSSQELGIGKEETRAGAAADARSRSRARRSTRRTTAASPATWWSSTATSAS